MAMKEIKVRLRFTGASVSVHQDKINLSHATLEPMGICDDNKPHKLKIDGKNHGKIQCEKCGGTICAEAIIAIS
jgi:hypothetical protein